MHRIQFLYLQLRTPLLFYHSNRPCLDLLVCLVSTVHPLSPYTAHFFTQSCWNQSLPISKPRYLSSCHQQPLIEFYLQAYHKLRAETKIYVKNYWVNRRLLFQQFHHLQQQHQRLIFMVKYSFALVTKMIF